MKKRAATLNFTLFDLSYNTYLQRQKHKKKIKRVENLAIAADRQICENNIEKGLELIKNALDMHKIMTTDSKDFFESMIIFLNSKALRLIERDQLKNAWIILKRCEYFLNEKQQADEFQSILPNLDLKILNTQSVWLKKSGDGKTALERLDKAQRMIHKHQLFEKGTTSLNICSCLSFQNNHQKALEYSKRAIIELTDELERCRHQDFNEYSSLLCFAYYNKSVEEEFLDNYLESLRSLENALVVCETLVGPNTPQAKEFQEKLRKLKHRIFSSNYKKSLIKTQLQREKDNKKLGNHSYMNKTHYRSTLQINSKNPKFNPPIEYFANKSNVLNQFAEDDDICNYISSFENDTSKSRMIYKYQTNDFTNQKLTKLKHLRKYYLMNEKAMELADKTEESQERYNYVHEKSENNIKFQDKNAQEEKDPNLTSDKITSDNIQNLSEFNSPVNKLRNFDKKDDENLFDQSLPSNKQLSKLGGTMLRIRAIHHLACQKMIRISLQSRTLPEKTSKEYKKHQSTAESFNKMITDSYKKVTTNDPENEPRPEDLNCCDMFRHSLEECKARQTKTNSVDAMTIAVGNAMAENVWDAIHRNNSESQMRFYGLSHNLTEYQKVYLFARFSYAAILIQKNVRMFLNKRFYKIRLKSKYKNSQLLYRKYQKIQMDGLQEKIFSVICLQCMKQMCIRFIVTINLDELFIKLEKDISVKELFGDLNDLNQIDPNTIRFHANNKLIKKATVIALKLSKCQIIMDGELEFDNKKKFEVQTEMIFKPLKKLDAKFNNNTEILLNRKNKKIASVATYENEELKSSRTNELDKNKLSGLDSDKVNFLSFDSSSSEDSYELQTHSLRTLKINNTAHLTNNKNMGISIFEIEQEKKVIKIQNKYRMHKAKKRFNKLFLKESIMVHQKDFSQEGENILIVIMKKLTNKNLTAYGLNLNTKEQLEPIFVGNDCDRNIKFDDIIEKIYVDIENCKIYCENFWGQADEEISSNSASLERQKALKHFQIFLRDKKFMQRTYIEKKDSKLVGKRSVQIEKFYFQIIAFILPKSHTFKVSVFSKRSSDFCYSQSFFLDKEYVTENDQINFGKPIFDNCKNVVINAGNIIELTLDFSHIKDIGPEYTSREILIIRSIQKRFMMNKIVENFFFETEDTTFEQEIVWLKLEKLFMIKIYAIIEVNNKPESIDKIGSVYSPQNSNENMSQKFLYDSYEDDFKDMDQERREKIQGLLKKFEQNGLLEKLTKKSYFDLFQNAPMYNNDTDSYNIINKFLNLQEKIKSKSLHQVLKVSHADLFLNKSFFQNEPNKRLIKKLMRFQILEKLRYKDQFTLLFWSKKEIADIFIIPKKLVNESQFLWTKFKSSDTQISKEIFEQSRLLPKTKIKLEKLKFGEICDNFIPQNQPEKHRDSSAGRKTSASHQNLDAIDDECLKITNFNITMNQNYSEDDFSDSDNELYYEKNYINNKTSKKNDKNKYVLNKNKNKSSQNKIQQKRKLLEESTVGTEPLPNSNLNTLKIADEKTENTPPYVHYRDNMPNVITEHTNEDFNSRSFIKSYHIIEEYEASEYKNNEGFYDKKERKFKQVSETGFVSVEDPEPIEILSNSKVSEMIEKGYDKNSLSHNSRKSYKKIITAGSSVTQNKNFRLTQTPTMDEQDFSKKSRKEIKVIRKKSSKNTVLALNLYPNSKKTIEDVINISESSSLGEIINKNIQDNEKDSIKKSHQSSLRSELFENKKKEFTSVSNSKENFINNDGIHASGNESLSERYE